MSRCMKCHKTVLAARVICEKCERKNIETITALEAAICDTCYRTSRNDLDHECQCCQPMRLLRELKK